MSHDREALWNTGHDESVEVNQRALIDKVLARYSGEFTVFRELLQNSDDARSSTVEIRFETEQYIHKDKKDSDEPQVLPDLKTAPVVQWTFRNNGIAFRDEDWSRLRKIAEGNPDEEKIGAFGVGFYSLFSVTENPFVSSGGHGMQFYWKDNKDQLHVRRGDLPSKGDSDPWTTFEMTLREPGPIPPAFDLMRFLASSITFMVHLNDVSVYFDRFRIGHLKKSTGVSRTLDIPKGLKKSSGLNIMHIQNIQSHQIRIEAEVMRAVYTVAAERPPALQASEPRKPQSGFFSSLLASFTTTTISRRPASPPVQLPPKALTELHRTSVTLTVFTAEVNVKVDKKLFAELLRSMKKNPPQQLRYNLIYTGKNEYDLSIADERDHPECAGGVFQGLRADLDGAGQARLFIGHATGQTTGIGGHMASRFIPTVERESIDLVDKNVAVWNRELLYVGGFLSRVAYDLELANINDLWEEAAKSRGNADFRPEPELEDWLRQRFVHILKFFTFRASTPSSEVSHLLERAFYGCSTNPLKLLSSAGVRGASDIKEPDPTFSEFLKYLPVLPEVVVREGALTVRALQSQGMISPITFHDVLSELRKHPLNEEELVACLKWWINFPSTNSTIDMDRMRVELLNATVLCPSAGDGKVLPLSAVQYFINVRGVGTHIPLDGPLPASLAPLSVTRHFVPTQLLSFGWKELTVMDWLQYISRPETLANNPTYDFTKSVEWSERVLTILSRTWFSLSHEAQNSVKVLLSGKNCVPTTSGLQTPGGSYFPTVKIFSDLPVVNISGIPIKGSMEKMLIFIGVRKHVDLQVVFDRMIKTGDWTIPDLIGYLVSVKDDLSAEEISRLSATSAFTGEGGNGDTGTKRIRHRACDLYEPIDIFRQLKLPVLDWGEKPKWKSTSEEAKLLFRLGLLRIPPLGTIVQLCSSPDAAVRTVAFKYLCDNIPARYPDYTPDDFANVAFIPAENEDGFHLGTIREVFGDPQWKLLGFSVVQADNRKDVAGKLGVQEHPPASMLLSLLEKTPPQNEAMARQWFEILSERVTSFHPAQLTTLSKIPIVPSKGSGSQPVRWLAPSQCYLGKPTGGEFHSKLFIFVDFGVNANRFLSACGSKNEPSVEEVAGILLADPRRFYDMAGGFENFLTELRNLAVNRRLLPAVIVNKMKTSPILLGIRRQKPTKTVTDSTKELDEDRWEFQHNLLKAHDIVIADDTNAYQLFGDSIFAAPQEDLLENFYAWLGCKPLSAVVREECKVSREIPNAKIATETRALVLERLPLFLHEHTHARTKVSLSWLSKPDNFKVRVFGKLTIVKTLDSDNIRSTRTQDASAAAKRIGQGVIELWLSYSGQVDMYEVATSLCRLLFETVKVNDTLLFMTILSTDLKALRRRGYNVDKILKQQQHEKQMAEEAKNRYLGSDSVETLTPPVSIHPGTAPVRARPPARRPEIPGGWETGLSSPPALPLPREPQSSQHILKEPEPTSDQATQGTKPLSSTLQNLTRKLVGMAPQNLSQEVISVVQSQRSREVTPQTDIRANVNMAIRACRPEQGKLLRNRQNMEIIKESLDEGYCDVSGQVGELDHLSTVGDIKVFVTKDVPETATFMTRKLEVLARFIHVITPLGKVYGLPTTALHIFCDSTGGLIAFNRNGSIFLNLRYFEAWHDEDVKKGDLSQAQISWFFTLAHEIAHNLVEPHNSEHEFYFSAICETHIVAFSRLLASPTLQ
ncbi:hypothetical protein F5J12DRAFT_816858 [Pisolithus orientalis]|uniref:uncharacterized protein n=1 Tax=Pisolithus orientalis TaxID=936130 RepID=UPI0022257E73|nr:uncharacterized protein F5J12DRAFT_816858 [Pisolithus orientalis]KAI6015244.1 hypothetical protein F5J12DRAFT_816858 [Pisolithus orientalis]